MGANDYGLTIFWEKSMLEPNGCEWQPTAKTLDMERVKKKGWQINKLILYSCRWNATNLT